MATAVISHILRKVPNLLHTKYSLLHFPPPPLLFPPLWDVGGSALPDMHEVRGVAHDTESMAHVDSFGDEPDTQGAVQIISSLYGKSLAALVFSGKLRLFLISLPLQLRNSVTPYLCSDMRTVLYAYQRRARRLSCLSVFARRLAVARARSDDENSGGLVRLSKARYQVFDEGIRRKGPLGSCRTGIGLLGIDSDFRKAG